MRKVMQLYGKRADTEIHLAAFEAVMCDSPFSFLSTVANVMLLICHLNALNKPNLVTIF